MAGRAMVDQQDLGKLSQHGLDLYRRKTVGFVWQYGARNLIPYLDGGGKYPITHDAFREGR